MKIKKLLKNMKERSIETVKTFPSSLVLIVIAFGLMTYNTWAPYNEPVDNVLEKLIPTLWVILPLFTVVHLFKLRLWTMIFAAILGVSLYSMLDDINSMEDGTKIGLWGAAFYLTLFALPMWKKENNMGFWQYTGQMLFVVCLGLVSSLVLSGSLDLAIVSIENLFDVSIDWRVTENIWIFGFFFFLPIFAHAWLPTDWKSLNKSNIVPHFLKPISYYLLLPIFFLYLGILSVYVCKIIFTGVWPSGEVAYPILFFSILFFGFYFISYPWQKAWHKWGFAALIPFFLVYFFAIYQRIGQYGFTEMRYLGVLLGTILLGTSLYFLFSKEKRFQVLVITLAGAAFLSVIGPWSMFNISTNDQKGRLENILLEYGLLQEGKLVTVEEAQVREMQPEKDLSDLQSEISYTVEFFSARDKMTELAKWTDLEPENYDSLTPDFFMQQMGLNFDYWSAQYRTGGNYFDYYREFQNVLNITGYDLLFEAYVDYGDYEDGPLIGENTPSLDLSIDADGYLTVEYDETSPIKINVMALEEKLKNRELDPIENPELFVLEGENKDITIRFVLNNLNGKFDDNNAEQLEDLSLSGSLLVDIK